MKTWIISFIVSFVVRQIAKFGKETDWLKVKTDADLRIRDLVPGEFFDDEAALLVSIFIDKAAIVLSRPEYFEDIINSLAAQRYDAAWATLKKLILEFCDLRNPSDHYLAEALKAV